MIRKTHILSASVLAGILAMSVITQSAFAADAGARGAGNVVLVHGAWADGSSWSKVIPSLEKAGLNAVAVQNLLTSLDDAPDVGEAVGELGRDFPPPPGARKWRS